MTLKVVFKTVGGKSQKNYSFSVILLSKNPILPLTVLIILFYNFKFFYY